MRVDVDAVVVGTGPNGLAAAITLARAGCSVRVVEANDEIGGGMRTAELTLPGFHHDVCSAVHPLAAASPFFRTLPLADHGLHWIDPPLPLAHPLDDGAAACLHRCLSRTVASIAGACDEVGNDNADGASYGRLLTSLVRDWKILLNQLLRPLRVPRNPVVLTRFGRHAVRSAASIARRFHTPAARAMLAGLAAHSALPLERPSSAAAALVLAIAGHAVGWPVPRGGSGRLARALASYLRSLGGEIETGRRVTSLDELPVARAVLLDLTPRQVLQLAGESLPSAYRRQLRRYRYGPGVCKVDLALDGAIPWRDEACRRAVVVHLGGTFEEIADAEARVWRGEHPRSPFVLLAQQSLFDHTRAPAGRHTVWAYCHVPNGSTVDMTDRIEAQIERFAPGFRERIVARHTLLPADLERGNANLVGGDINGGAAILSQWLTRPAIRWNPYTTPLKGVFLCSASTPPGGGVHGMCGHHAAVTALRHI